MALAGLVAVLAGCGGSEASPPPTPPAPPVGDVARNLVLQGADKAIVLVRDGPRTYAAAAGQGARANQRFRVGSVTKTFTAAIVLQLVAERKLRLDNPAARYLPGLVPAKWKITIRDLLNHRSGLANFTDDLGWLAAAEQSSTTGPRKALRFAVSRGRQFAAGTSWAYSNTNYTALGLVIERVTGRSYAKELSRRIFEPLGLTRTQLASTRSIRDLDDLGTNPRLPWAAGGIVSDGPDLARFFSALLTGKLLSFTGLSTMKQTVPTSLGPSAEDGLGIFATSLDCGRAWGHSGGILDYATEAYASDDGRRVAVISVRGPVSGQPPISELICS